MVALVLVGSGLRAQETMSSGLPTDKDLGETINFLYQNDVLDDEDSVSGYAQGEVENTKIRTLKYSPSWRLRDVEDDSYGLRIKARLSVGFLNFDDYFFGEQVRISAKSVALVPEAELRFMPRHNWHLKPFVEVGLGRDLEAAENAFIYSAGIRSTTEFPWKRKIFSLLASAKYSESVSSLGTYDDDFAYVDAGPQIVLPTGLRLGQAREVETTVFMKVRYYIRDLVIREPSGRAIEIDERFEVGVRLASRPRLRIWKLKVPGIKISYTVGDGFTSVKIGFG